MGFNMTLKELENAYNEQSNKRKEKIKQEPSKWKRFWKWVWYLTTFPWIWCWYNFRDWRTFVIFIIVMLVVGIEVWLPLLLGIILNNAWLIGIATVCEAFWLAPGTPFVIICIFITIGIKGIFNKIRERKNDKKN